jgi:hypothetical protein
MLLLQLTPYDSPEHHRLSASHAGHIIAFVRSPLRVVGSITLFKAF